MPSSPQARAIRLPVAQSSLKRSPSTTHAIYPLNTEYEISTVNGKTHTLGALFIRTYERGERIQVAMLARGFDGSTRGWDTAEQAAPREWLTAAVLPLTAAGLLCAGVLW